MELNKFIEILRLDNPRDFELEELKDLYYKLEFKQVRHIFNTTDIETRQKPGFKDCFISLLPMFSADSISCNNFVEDLAQLYIHSIEPNLLIYTEGIISAMITNPRVKYNTKTVNMYLDKVIDKYSKPIFKTFDLNQIKLMLKLRSELDNQDPKTTYQKWLYIFKRLSKYEYSSLFLK